MHFLAGFWVAMIFLWFWHSSHISIGTGRLSTPAVDTALRSRHSDSAEGGDQAPNASESCRTKHGQSANLFILLILTLSFVALVGVLWEFFEFTYDAIVRNGNYAETIRMFGYSVKDLYKDTLGDLFFDLLGGLICYFYIEARTKFSFSKK